MANEEHLARLQQGIEAWNQWRKGRCSALGQQCALALRWAWGTTAPAGRHGLQTIKETGQKTFARLRAMPWQAIALRYKASLLILGGVVLAVFLLIKVPQWQAARWEGRIEAKEVAKQESDTRTTVVQVIGGAVLFIGLYFTAKTWRTTQEGQITDRFTKAINQLGEAGPEKLAIQLGGIYALERIARDSERDHWPIMEILTAYVREHAPWPPKTIPLLADDLSPTEKSPEGKDQPLPKLATDIQAILTVLGRRARTFGKGEDQCLDLTHTALRGANLREAHLEEADLWGAYLEGANLGHAHLEGAFLWGAHLEGASLWDAHLEKASLWQTHLERAQLEKAHLAGADLREAHLEGADLREAHLEGAKSLTVEQLSTVKTLYEARLDPPLLIQIQRLYPHLLEEPQA
jgi:hypothetical protein